MNRSNGEMDLVGSERWQSISSNCHANLFFSIAHPKVRTIHFLAFRACNGNDHGLWPILIFFTEHRVAIDGWGPSVMRSHAKRTFVRVRADCIVKLTSLPTVHSNNFSLFMDAMRWDAVGMRRTLPHKCCVWHWFVILFLLNFHFIPSCHSPLEWQCSAKDSKSGIAPKPTCVGIFFLAHSHIAICSFRYTPAASSPIDSTTYRTTTARHQRQYGSQNIWWWN